MKPLKHLPAWKALEQHFKIMRNFDMRAAFREDATRFDQLSLRCGTCCSTIRRTASRRTPCSS
jgi:glucose-6-phosphate isomerase